MCGPGRSTSRSPRWRRTSSSDESHSVSILSMASDSPSLPVGTVTLLLADVEGSTRLWEKEPSVMKEALARHDGAVVEILRRHAGARPVEQGEGDSFVAAFA